MKIGVMLRHLGSKGPEMGTRVYTENVVEGILERDKKNQYLLIYNDQELLGKYSGYPNAREIVIRMPTKLLWDQFAIPLLAKKEKLDLIFNPKFTVSLFSGCKTVFVLHGMEWYVYPEAYKWYDIIYVKFALPFYCRKADSIVAVSKLVKSDIVKYIGINEDKIKAIYEAANKIFGPIKDQDTLMAIKEKYNLPDRFILYVGGIFPSKNFSGLVKAFYNLKKEGPYNLVVVGSKRWKFEKDFKLISKLDLDDDIHFTGRVPQMDLPAFYNLAEMFVFPSLYEGFGIPILEAMACGCPVIASKTGALPEIAGNAAAFIDPYDIDEMSATMHKVLADEDFRQDLIEKGYKQVKKFSWEKCAKEIIEAFRELERENN